MVESTVQDAITQVAINCSLTDGQNMTPYSQQTIAGYLSMAHKFIRDEAEWEEMVIWRPNTLDGVTGKVSTLITDIYDWKQIKRIYHEQFQTALPLLSTYVNPLSSQLMMGYRGLDPASDNTGTGGRYLVQFYPPTLTGRVLFQAHRFVDFSIPTTIIPIDWTWHVTMASWMFCQDDGTNPGQIDKYAKLTSMRKAQVMALENSRPVLMQPNQVIPSDWFEADAPYS